MSNRPGKIHLLNTKPEIVPDMPDIGAKQAKIECIRILKKEFERTHPTSDGEVYDEEREAAALAHFQKMSVPLVKSYMNQLVGGLAACSLATFMDTSNTGDERYAVFATMDGELASKIAGVIREHNKVDDKDS